jgi:multidrug efflux pump subunit AcrA (membrane-fusion protein)
MPRGNKRIITACSTLLGVILIAATLTACGGAQAAGLTSQSVSTTGSTTVLPASTSDSPETTASAAGVLSSVSIMMAQTLVPESFDFAVIPCDQNGNVLDVDGTISVKLWSVENGDFVDPGQLIQEWDNVKLDQQDFIEDVGTMVSLPYVNYRPASGTSAFAQVTVTNAAGLSVTSDTQLVQIRHPLGC